MSMDRSAVKAIVDANIKRAQWETQTQEWSLTIVYGRTDDDGAIAQVQKYTSYRRATITIDPDEHEDEAHVLNTLRHELLHVVLAPFDRFCILAEHLVGSDQKALAAMRAAWCDAHEVTVGNLERLLDQQGRSNPYALPGREPIAAEEAQP